jgi:hypothetical protein
LRLSNVIFHLDDNSCAINFFDNLSKRLPLADVIVFFTALAPTLTLQFFAQTGMERYGFCTPLKAMCGLLPPQPREQPQNCVPPRKSCRVGGENLKSL